MPWIWSQLPSYRAKQNNQPSQTKQPTKTKQPKRNHRKQKASKHSTTIQPKNKTNKPFLRNQNNKLTNNDLKTFRSAGPVKQTRISCLALAKHTNQN
jgi:hypothetical protein